MVATDAQTATTFALSHGQAGDAAQGRALVKSLCRPNYPPIGTCRQTLCVGKTWRQSLTSR